MSIIYNSFAGNIETAFMQVLDTYCKMYYVDYNKLSIVNTAGDKDIYANIENFEPTQPVENLVINIPRLICSCISTSEELYQSGIYRANMEFIMKTSIDTDGYNSAKSLYGIVCDCLQQPLLPTLLKSTKDINNNNLVYIHGLIFGESDSPRIAPGTMSTAKLNDIENRIFTKTITMDVIGNVYGADGSHNQI